MIPSESHIWDCQVLWWKFAIFLMSFSNHKSGFSQILHHSSLSWEITPLYFFRPNIIYHLPNCKSVFLQITLHCYEIYFVSTFLPEILYNFNCFQMHKIQSKATFLRSRNLSRISRWRSLFNTYTWVVHQLSKPTIFIATPIKKCI